MPGRTSKTKQDDAGRMAVRNHLVAIKNAVKERLKQKTHAQVATVEIPEEVDVGFSELRVFLNHFQVFVFAEM